jgi:hypothetical protein
LFALKSIIDAKETSALKIELLTKKLYNTLWAKNIPQIYNDYF